MQLAIICASAPVLRVLFRKYLSDPISRAVQTASSKSRSGNRSGNRSGIRSTNRDSKTMDDVVNYSLKNDDEWRGAEDKTLARQSVKPSMETLGDLDSASTHASTHVPSERYRIKTAEDYETYALQNLERSRTQTRRYTLTRHDERDIQPTMNHPEQPWTTPKTWLDSDAES